MNERGILRTGRLPPAGWFTLCLLGGYGVERWHPAPLGWWLGPARLPVGVALLTAAALLGLRTLALFALRRTTPMPGGQPTALLTSGPFRISRNPLYVAGVAAEVALGLLLDSGWIALVALPLFVALDRLVIPREEARLQATFGAAYAAYAARVRRWL